MGLRLSDNSETIMQKAEQLSSRKGHFYLGVEHVFLSIVESSPAMAEIVENQGIDMEDLQENIFNICGPGDDAPLWKGIIKTPRLKKILKNAGSEAESVKAYRIEPQHILAAIYKESWSVPARALEGLGADLKTLYYETLNQQDAPKNAKPYTPNMPVPPYAGYSGGRGPQVMPPVSPAAFSGPVGKQSPQQQMPPKASSGWGASRSVKADPAAQGKIDKKEDKDKKKKRKTPTLDKLGRDLVEMAKEGRVDPIVGRKDEIRRVMQTLTKKMKNNPIIIGEAGVGKTAVVYGLAQRIADGKVPQAIKDKAIVELGMSSIVAGAKHRGEFEERMQKLIKELMEHKGVILFIDEIHTIMGAGDSRGPMNAGNILKPHLARNDITVIGATTIEEYRRFIEKDPALERRFQPVLVDEPSEEETVEILNGLKERYEKHHDVTIDPKAVLAAVKMSVRYIPDRNLPDKAIDLMDEAAAKSQMKFTSITSKEDLQKNSNLVTENNIAEVISLWTGIPAAKLTQEESERLLHVEEHLRKRVVGQEAPVHTVAQTIRMARMGLTSPNRPSGVFLFLGPTGVGKTELAKSLAEFLFGSEKDLIRLDMSEFMEKHAISRMIGSPPGYVGHEEEGQLTSQVRTHPYSVVLLDEVEKAHIEVFDLFLQVFDDGRLTDSKGRTVNFTNTIIIMTSNIGMKSIQPEEGQVINTQDPAVRDIIMQELKGHFRPEFLNRIDEIVIFNSLSDEALAQIVRMNLQTLANQLYKQREISLQVEDSAIGYLMMKGYDPAYGARPMKRAIANYLSKPLAEAMLSHGVQPGDSIIVRHENECLIFQKEGAGDFWSCEAPETGGMTSFGANGSTNSAMAGSFAVPQQEKPKPPPGMTVEQIQNEIDRILEDLRIGMFLDMDVADSALKYFSERSKGPNFKNREIKSELKAVLKAPLAEAMLKSESEEKEKGTIIYEEGRLSYVRADKTGQVFPRQDNATMDDDSPPSDERRMEMEKGKDDHRMEMPDPVEYVKTPFSERKPILRKRTKDMQMMGMAPMKGPLGGKMEPPDSIDPEDFEQTKPGGS